MSFKLGKIIRTTANKDSLFFELREKLIEVMIWCFFTAKIGGVNYVKDISTEKEAEAKRTRLYEKNAYREWKKSVEKA